MQKLKILMLGESLDRQGGIVSVEKLIMKQAPTEIEIIHISTLPNGSTIRKIFVFIQALLLLSWRLLKSEADIVHIHVSERGSAFRQAFTTTIAWLLRKPVIIHTHSADFHVFYANLPQIIKVGLSWIFCKSTRFIVLSESWKKFYMENLGLKVDQVVILPNPVKFPLEIPQRIKSQKVNFLFLGRIGERKGAFDLIDAFAAIPTDQKQNAQLIMAGDGEGEKARDIVKKLNLSEYITILDWVNERQRDELLAKADVFVLPSYNEGLPMALLEAMSWGLPVITTPVGGIPELVIDHKNGLLVQPGNIQELSTAMQLLLANQELKRRLGENARNSTKPFDVKNYFVSLSNIYQSVLS
ncbi:MULTISPECIES: glycosyltransferase family 4 protein [unclassified Anabaena]|uniref:glycosyltransferase family 4 protein n=1 Tax=unclassified Anabaena TaxID=2619674 RepID=UPI001447700E|nr:MULTISPECIES: glycosyltransferase family 4 protein [unclassified Anabaena]MTJ08755.1 glycosyltransferase family 4 protein [Anabaena sp. UHCC 0204]MTJ53066.1 glycosyltransferase family 4 protein [Anabaena sp. UHCC 0253]